jgi:hypothetical protein
MCVTSPLTRGIENGWRCHTHILKAFNTWNCECMEMSHTYTVSCEHEKWSMDGDVIHIYCKQLTRGKNE